MTRRAIVASVLVHGALLWMCTAPAAAAEATAPVPQTSRRPVELFHEFSARATLFSFDRAIAGSGQRFHLEMVGARAQAEDWLHDAGFSLLEERDAEGRRSYTVLKDTSLTEWPVVRLRARIGRPQLAAGLRVRRELPAIGIMVPWQRYTLELEGLDDRALGYVFIGTVRWSDELQRLQYGVALPIGMRDRASVGALLQIRLRFGR